MQASKGKIVNLAVGKRIALRRQLACVRRTHNHYLAANIERYQRDRTFTFFHEMSADCTCLRKAEKEFCAAPRGAQTCALKALDRALRDSFSGASCRRGFPRFKAAAAKGDSMTIQAAEVGFLRSSGLVTHIRWPKVGLLRVKGARLPDGARVAFVTIREIADGYAVSFNFELAEKPAAEAAPQASVGIDLGLTSLVTLSTGEKIEAPRFYRKAERRLRTAQRSLSRKRKGSVNRRRQRRRVARLHARTARLRENHQHHLTRRLVNEYQRIAMEDLALRGLARTRLSKSVYDAGWGEIRRQLFYKTDWAGRSVVLHPRFERSTGICPDCQEVGPRLDLRLRRWRCSACGVEHDRDVAAAQVIERTAMVGTASPEPAPRRRKRASADKCRKVASPPSDRAGPATNVLPANSCLQAA